MGAHEGRSAETLLPEEQVASLVMRRNNARSTFSLTENPVVKRACKEIIAEVDLDDAINGGGITYYEELTHTSHIRKWKGWDDVTDDQIKRALEEYDGVHTLANYGYPEAQHILDDRVAKEFHDSVFELFDAPPITQLPPSTAYDIASERIAS